jgi:predicted TIM-barrel fold metal-dependent hydrolase
MSAPVTSGVVDYLCNAFNPEREKAWDEATAAQGIPLKIRRDPTDSFAESDVMVARMDELGIATLLVATSDIHHHKGFPFHIVSYRWEEAEDLVRRHPGRFLALWGLDPEPGMDGVRRAEEAVRQDWVAGMYLHTHSFDRRFDHADYYPFYALAGRYGVPVIMQAGTSGGLMPSECGVPIGIDRPAMYFRDTNFVLSHTGWPWVEETISMALKHSNVYLGTGAYPPRHWGPALVDFIRRPGRRKVLFGTNFPTVGHRHALAQVDELDLTDEARHNLLEGNARSIFTRLASSQGSQQP